MSYRGGARGGRGPMDGAGGGAVRIGEDSFATRMDIGDDGRGAGLGTSAADFGPSRRRGPRAGDSSTAVAACLSRADAVIGSVSPRSSRSERGDARSSAARGGPRGVSGASARVRGGRAPATTTAAARRAKAAEAVAARGLRAAGASRARPAAGPAGASASTASAGRGKGKTGASAASASSSSRLSMQRFGSGSANKGRTEFARAHRSGLPFRLEHRTSGRHALRWDVPVERVDCERLLPVCAAGLSEVAHPYALLARTALRDILAIRPSAASGRTLETVMRHVRGALGQKEKECQQAGLLAVKNLSAACGEALNASLHTVLPALARRASAGGSAADHVLSLCEVLEANGGPVAGDLIKAKIPTYSSIMF